MTDPVVTLRITADAAALPGKLQQAAKSLTDVGRAGEQGGERASRAMRKTEESASRLSTGIGKLAGRLAAAFSIAQYVRLSDAYANISSRLRIVTQDEGRYRAALDQTYAVAQRTFAELEGTAVLYGRLQKATDDLGRSQSEALRTTELINKTFGISGASAQQMQGSIVQLAQGLSAGALRGEEFNSVLEGAPRLADALSASLGVGRGELRKMAEQGQLTADVIIDAILKQGDAIDAEFSQLPITSARAWQQLQNAALRTVGEIEQVLNGSGTLARGLQAIAELVERIPTALAIWAEEFARIQTVGDGAIGALVQNFDLVQARAVELGRDIADTFLVLPVAIRTAVTIGIGEFDQLRIKTVAQFEEIGARIDEVWVAIKAGATAVGNGIELVFARAKDAVIGRLAEMAAGAAELAAKAPGASALAGALAELETKLRSAASAEAEVQGRIAANADIYKEERAQIAGRITDIERARDTQIAASRSAVDAQLAEFDAAKQRIGAERELAKASTATGTAMRKAGADAKSYANDLKAGAATAEQWAKAAEKQREALGTLDRIIADAAGTLSGPMLEALADNQDALEELTEATDVLLAQGPVTVELQERIAQAYDTVTAAAEGRVAQARREEDVLGNLAAAYEREIQLAGLSTSARNTELRVEEAMRIARQVRGEAYAIEHAAEIRRQAELAESNVVLAEKAGQAADDYERVWSSGVDSVSTAFGDWIAGGLKSFKDFGSALKDIAKRMLADLVALFFKNRIILPITMALSGGSAIAGQAGQLLGGGGGGLGQILGLGGNAGAGGSGGFGSLISGASGFVGALSSGVAATAAMVGNLGVVNGLLTSAQYGFAALSQGSIGLGLGALAGPIAAIAAVAAIVDKISGGKLFGTKFQATSSETSIGIGADGGSASALVNEERQRSLFRGTQRRTRSVDPGSDAVDAASQLFDAVEQVMLEGARALQSEVPPVIDAAIRTLVEYDKGNEKSRKILVDVLGRTWEEATEEAAATRITAEALIQTIDAALGGVADAIVAGVNDAGSEAAAGAGSAGGSFGEEWGRQFHKSARESVDASFDDGTTAAIRGEASAIAERWRGDAEQLMQGAQFLLAAASDIRNGTELLGEGSSLTYITDLTEELQASGEPLIQTYQRMVVSTKLLDEALALSGVELNKSREELVRFAVEISEAAGGVDRAAALWSSYFETFYSAEERIALALDRARTNADQQFGDIGLNAGDFEGDEGAKAFRDLFEARLPTLSAEAVVEWLEAADALGLVINLTGQYAQALGAAATSIEDLMAGVEQTIADLEPPEELNFADRIAAINAQTDELLARADELNASEEQMQRIRYAGQLQLNQVLAEQAAALADYESVKRPLQDELDNAGMTPLQIELRDIGRWAAEAEAELNAAAAAAGLVSASEEDLALVRGVAAQRIQAAIDAEAAAQAAALASYEQRVQGLQDELDNAGMTPLEIELRDIGRWAAAAEAELNAAAVAAGMVSASEADLALVRDVANQRIQQAIDAQMAAQAAALASYNNQVQQIADMVNERSMTAFQIELRDIRRWGAEAADGLNAAARAAGMEAAASQDLALVHEEVAARVAAAIARLRDRGRDLAAQLQGSPLDQIEEQIRVLEAAQGGYVQGALEGIEQIQQATDNAYQAQRNAQLRIREFLDGLLLGPLGGLRPRDALAEGQAQFQALLERALGGDADAAAALPALAQQLLTLGQQVFSSGDPYFELRDSIIAALEQVAALPIREPAETGPVGGAPGGGGGPVQIGASPELQELYAERDRLLAEQTAAERLALAQELTGIIRDLVLATGDPLAQIAADLNLNLNELVTDLGVNLDDLTVSTAIQLADIAQSMGVNLTELATSVGVDLGNLADAQSLLNDALEDEINKLPAEEAERLRPMLRAVEDAAALGDTAGVEAGIGALEGAINGLDQAFIDALAPFFDGVDPTEPLTEISYLSAIDAATALSASELQLHTGLLTDIRDRVGGSFVPVGPFGDPNQPGVPVPPAAGVPGFASGTPEVTRSGLAIIHEGEAVLPAAVARFFRREGIPTPPQSVRDDVASEVRALRRETSQALAALRQATVAVETATKLSGSEQAKATRDAAEKLARAAR